jgi:hypothetical protein
MGFNNMNDRVERLERKVESILNSVHSIKSDIEHIDKTVTKLSSNISKNGTNEESFKEAPSTAYSINFVGVPMTAIYKLNDFFKAKNIDAFVSYETDDISHIYIDLGTKDGISTLKSTLDCIHSVLTGMVLISPNTPYLMEKLNTLKVYITGENIDKDEDSNFADWAHEVSSIFLKNQISRLAGLDEFINEKIQYFVDKQA